MDHILSGTGYIQQPIYLIYLCFSRTLNSPYLSRYGRDSTRNLTVGASLSLVPFYSVPLRLFWDYKETEESWSLLRGTWRPTTLNCPPLHTSSGESGVKRSRTGHRTTTKFVSLTLKDYESYRLEVRSTVMVSGQKELPKSPVEPIKEGTKVEGNSSSRDKLWPVDHPFPPVIVTERWGGRRTSRGLDWHRVREGRRRVCHLLPENLEVFYTRFDISTDKGNWLSKMKILT